nr:nickel pincer cofactor biosynthesis protein LarB [uncultured Cohaesibacter sp.]
MSEKSAAIRFDWARRERTGVPEAVFCENKSIEQLAAIIAMAKSRSHPLLLTRLDADKAELLASPQLDYEPVSRTGVIGGRMERCFASPALAIVGAGTSDLPVMMEAKRSAEYLGIETDLFADIGVAGLWRLLDAMPEISQYKVIIAVAGMEGALFSVLAGLVSAPLIAVPTSVGYGVAEGGKAALSSALGACSPGIMTVNIDNGFGAAAAAFKILALTK